MTRRTRVYLSAIAGLVGLTAVGASNVAAQSPSVKTAVLDVQRILAESTAGKKELARLKQVEEEKTTQLKQKEAEINKLKERLADLGFTISEAERTKLQRDIEDRMIEGERFRKDSLRQIKSLYEDVLADFEKRVGPIIEKIGAERGITLILHRDNPAIAWADQSIDITGEVIKKFDAGGGK